MLNSKKIAFLKALSHHKKPIVTIGNKGLTEPVVKEIMAGLKAHENSSFRGR
jgi:RNA-binding protein YhbY